METENKKESKKQNVPFTPEQMEVVQQLILSAKNGQDQYGKQTISRFTDVRDPKEIMTCPVYRFDGKFVIGFKDQNNDPYRKHPKYYELKFDMNRKLQDQPFVTLLLSNDGEEITEKEVNVADYVANRVKVEIPKESFTIKTVPKFIDHGVLGGAASGMASEIDSNGKQMASSLVKAESKQLERTFIINLPGFSKAVEIPEVFLA